MKLIKNSSLFFSLLFVCFCPKNAKAQQTNDSLVHYYNLYINAKENVDFKKVYLFFNQHKEENQQKKDTSNIVVYLIILSRENNDIVTLFLPLIHYKWTLQMNRWVY